MSAFVRRMVCLLTAFMLTAFPLTGCGGGGGGGGGDDGGDEPPPTPPPPAVEIGPGPGPAADAIPGEPAISTVAARATPYAQAPRRGMARQEAVDRIERFAGRPPTTEAELRAFLADFTGWVTQEPDDPVSQAGLAVAVLVAGAYNAAIDAGYTPDQVLSLLEPVTRIKSAAGEDPGAGVFTAALRTMADFPEPSDPDFSSADLQIGIRKFLLPAFRHANDRIASIPLHSGGDETRLAAIHTRDGTRYAYAADFRALNGFLHAAESLLLEFCAYQFNPGDWDWTVPLADRDEDGDGLLTADEYLPPDPFGWRHQSSNMSDSQDHMLLGLDTMLAAVEAAPEDSFLIEAIGDDGRPRTAAKLRDLRDLVTEKVQVEVIHEGGTNGPGRFMAQMTFHYIWDAPVDDLKTIAPVLQPVADSNWQALPRGPGDFPRPRLGGMLGQPPEPVLEMLSTGPTYIAISYGSWERLTMLDERGTP